MTKIDGVVETFVAGSGPSTWFSWIEWLGLTAGLYLLAVKAPNSFSFWTLFVLGTISYVIVASKAVLHCARGTIAALNHCALLQRHPHIGYACAALIPLCVLGLIVYAVTQLILAHGV